MEILKTVFGLLFLFQVKHWLCDFPLQTAFMLGKFKGGWDWVKPLLAHSGVHALATALIVVLYTGSVSYAIVLAALDFSLHFLMDRVKASPNMLGRFKALTASEFAGATDAQKRGNKLFWWSLGIDQMWHHLCHYGLIYLILIRLGIA